MQKLSFQAVQKLITGWIWPVRCSLPSCALEKYGGSPGWACVSDVPACLLSTPRFVLCWSLAVSGAGPWSPTLLCDVMV